MNIVEKPSPNFDNRGEQAVDMVVLHYTGMKTPEDALTRLCDAVAKVSAHYVVDEDGIIYRLVAENKRAWHAGVSFWREQVNINHRSIGIEIVNPGHEFGYRKFPRLQMESVAQLCTDILSRHAISPRNIIGHSDIAPGRKEDPGELFDWQWLARQGVGVWPSKPGAAQASARDLRQYGYNVSDLPKAITAFQRHFRQKSLTGQWDNECSALLASLLAGV
jgi:N-acetylmuramoyl-L-alanine amidase